MVIAGLAKRTLLPLAVCHYCLLLSKTFILAFSRILYQLYTTQGCRLGQRWDLSWKLTLKLHSLYI